MNDSFAVASEMRSWWSNEGQIYHDRLMQAKTDIDSCNISINAIKSRKADGSLFKFLSNAWQRATSLPALNNKLNELEKEQDSMASLLSDKAAEHGDSLLASIASEQAVVWTPYSAIMMGLSTLGQQKKQAEQNADLSTSAIEAQYNTAMEQYINLRLYIAGNTKLPKIFYSYIPQTLADDRQNPSAAWRFDI